MNREDVIHMARQAGCDPHDMSSDFSVNLDDLIDYFERFAAIVAAAIAKAEGQE